MCKQILMGGRAGGSTRKVFQRRFFYEKSGRAAGAFITFIRNQSPAVADGNGTLRFEGFDDHGMLQLPLHYACALPLAADSMAFHPILNALYVSVDCRVFWDQLPPLCDQVYTLHHSLCSLIRNEHTHML
jgi:hypothetical protein